MVGNAPDVINGRYAVQGVVGCGSTSLVFDVQDGASCTRRALKVLRADHGEALFRGEFARLSLLDHPNLVRVHDVGRLGKATRHGDVLLPAGAPFMVLDYVEGTDAGRWLEALPEAERDAALRGLAESLAGALEQLHARGLVHHDVKPDNIIVDSEGRAILIDFGLATRGRHQMAGRGTLQYLSPEALGGGGDHRADLYALGATLYEFATGEALFRGAGPELVRQILHAEPAPAAPSWLAVTTRQILDKLLHKQPAERMPSARALRAALARARGDSDRVTALSTQRMVLPPAFCGQQLALEELARAFDSGSPRAIVVMGAPGTGKSRLVQEGLRQLRMRWLLNHTAPLQCVTVGEGPRGGGAEPYDLDDMARLEIERLEQSFEAPLLHLEGLPEDPLGRRIFEMVVADDACSLRVLAEIDGQHPCARELLADGDAQVCRVSVQPLDGQTLRALMRSMLASEPTKAEVAQVERISAGNVSVAVECTRALALGASLRELAPESHLQQLLARELSVLSEEDRRLVFGLAVWGEPLPSETLAQLVGFTSASLWSQIFDLVERGVVVAEVGMVGLPAQAHYRVWRVLAKDAARPLHRAAAELRPDELRRAEHLAEAADPRCPDPVALGEIVRAVEQFRRRHLISRGVALAEHGLELAQGWGGEACGPSRLALEVLYGRLLVMESRYDEALAYLPPTGEGAVHRAEALQRKGEYEQALAVLSVAEAADRYGADALAGRILLRLGRGEEVLHRYSDTAKVLLAQGGDQAAVAAGVVEVVGLAHFYQGDRQAAARFFAWEGAEDERTRARFFSMRGMVEFAEGRIVDAAHHYQRAVEGAERAGDAHGLATYVGNLGSARLELGQYGRSLGDLSRAVRELSRLGRTAERTTALCNLAGLMLLLRDDGRAAQLADEAAELLDDEQPGALGGYVQMLRGEIAEMRGESHAWELLRRASGLLDSSGAIQDAALARCAEASALTRLGRLDEAQQALAGLPATLSPAVGRARGLVEARTILAGAMGTGNEEATAVTLAEHAAGLEGQRALGEFWRLAAVLARLLAHLGRDGAARAAAEKAKGALEKIMSDAPEIYREPMSQDPDAKALREQWRALVASEDGAPSLPSDESRPGWRYEARRLRRLLTINKRLNSDLRLPRVLENILDAVIELTDAERGFVVLVDSAQAEEDGFSVRVARNMDQTSISEHEASLSRSIAQQVMKSGRPIVTYDAGGDDRFAQAVSVGSLSLRSVLAVPLSVKGAVVGTIYVDHRLRSGAFGDDDVALVEDFAQQAAIALDTARLLEENAVRERRIATLNEKLQQEVEIQAVELEEVREELRSSKDALELRHEYGNIVGRSSKMLNLFHLLDRVTDTRLPVVIQGESGTGKELVARAIHHNGPRSQRAFVSENCGAIPETLLESVLFGAVRGAYTGSDRDRRGLFKVADGGTLFLDEVGEMSASMQTKLLRVLQDGEFRPVGGERVLQVDVRVLAASNKDLEKLVEVGAFREDLFYRLNVVRIEVPPLRERREDIPLLVERFLEKHAGGKPRVSDEVMAAFVNYRWPGNVRELENEIMRLVALAGDAIEVRDLSVHIRGEPQALPLDPDDLSLRPRVAELERTLIQLAMEKTKGNQSRAARLLGLSRYGLQKKLKRLAD